MKCAWLSAVALQNILLLAENFILKVLTHLADTVLGIQNAAARLVFGLRRYDHVTPSLIQLHWLPVSYRIKFKLCCLMHAVHHCRSTTYLTATVQPVNASRSRSGLRSSATSLLDYSLPRLRTKFGERAFSHAGPSTWNALPDNIRTVADPVKFRKLLKSYYFTRAYDVY